MSSLHSPPVARSSARRALQLFESSCSFSTRHLYRRPPPGWTFAQNTSTSCLQGESGLTPAGAATAAPPAGSADLASGLPVPAAAGAGGVAGGLAVWATSGPAVKQIAKTTTRLSFMVPLPQ